MSQSLRSSISQPSVEMTELGWQIQLYDLLTDADSRIHRAMQQCIESATQAKSQIVNIVDDAIVTSVRERESLLLDLHDALLELEAMQKSRFAAPPAASSVNLEKVASAVISAARERTEKELTPIRTTVQHLHSIESRASTALSTLSTSTTTDQLDVEQETVEQPLIAVGINTYRQAVELMQSIHDHQVVRDVDIFSYQPGRLVLILTVQNADRVADHVLVSSTIPLIRLADDAGALSFRVSA
jgi:hypothetical protein